MKALLTLITGSLAALPVSAVSAQEPGAVWPLAAEGGTCTIGQSFADAEFGNHRLEVGYDPARREVWLTAIPSASAGLSDGDVRNWHIVFLDNGRTKHDDAWGARSFSIAREGDVPRFTTRFAGERNVRQILADLAGSRALGLLQDGEVVTAFDLAAIDPSIERLRRCAATPVAAN